MRKLSLLLVNGVDRKRQIIRSELESFPEFQVVHESRSLSDALKFVERRKIDVVCLSPVIRWQLKFLGRAGHQLSAPVVYIDWYAEIDSVGDETQNIRRKQYFQAVREKLCSMISPDKKATVSLGSDDPDIRIAPFSFVLIVGLNGDLDVTRSVISSLDQTGCPIVIAQNFNKCFAYHYERQLNQVSAKKARIFKHQKKLDAQEILLVLLDKPVVFAQTDTGTVLITEPPPQHESPETLLENLLKSVHRCQMTGLVIFMPETINRYSEIIKDIQLSGIQTIFIKPWKTTNQSGLNEGSMALHGEMIPVQQLKQHLPSMAADTF